jgi:hypothetical protein
MILGQKLRISILRQNKDGNLYGNTLGKLVLGENVLHHVEEVSKNEQYSVLDLMVYTNQIDFVVKLLNQQLHKSVTFRRVVLLQDGRLGVFGEMVR